jgi:WD40 repeat protein
MSRHFIRAMVAVAAALLMLALAAPADEPSLPEGALARVGAPLLRHPGGVINIAFAPDGKTFVSVGDPQPNSKATDNLVIQWDAATGKRVRQFRGHTAGVQSVAFSPDGEQIVTGSTDRTLRLWEVATGKELMQFAGHTDVVLPIAFSPDGKLVASESHDLTVRVWDVATGKEVHKLPGHKSGGTSNVAFSPDGKTLASVGADFAVRLWDVGSGKEVRQFKGHPSDVESVAFSPDGRHLATAGDDRTVRLWDVETGKEERRFAGCTNVVTTVRFAPGGATLAAGSADQAVRFWEVETGKLLAAARGHTGNVSEIAFAPDGKTLASAGHDGTVRLWGVATGRALPQTGGTAFRAALSPDGTRLATSANDVEVRFWDPKTGKELPGALKIETPVTALAFAHDGKTLAVGRVGGHVALWDVAAGRRLRETGGQGGFTTRIEFTPNGRVVVATGLDTVRLWDAATAKPTAAAATLADAVGKFGTPLTSALAPDGTLLATVGLDGAVHVWDVARGLEVHAPLGVAQPGLPTALAWSADGRTLAVSLADRGLRLWEVATGKERRRMTLPSVARSLSISVDGRLLTAGCTDGTIRSWDLAARKELLPPRRGHTGTVTLLALSADGGVLASAGVPALVFSPQNRAVGFAASDAVALTWDAQALRKTLSDPAKPAAADVEGLWTSLVGNDAAKAYDAAWRLIAAPELAMPVLRERVPKAVAKEEPGVLDKLLADLDHDDFDVREKATNELIRRGPAVLPAVRETLSKTKSREVRRRAEEVAAQLKTDGGVSPEMLPVLRGVEVVERIGTAEAREMLEAWTHGPAEAPLVREARASLRRLGKR